MLQQNHFALFGLEPGFGIDPHYLAERYRELQRQVHPDRFAGASDQERLLSVQQAAQVNEAYQTLKSPLRRARYLLTLRGVELNEQDTRMDPLFLMEQIELREALAAVAGKGDPLAALMALRDTIETKERALVTSLTEAFARGDEAALEEARVSVRKLQFMARLNSEVEELEEGLA
ncbi:MAG: co-chaperone HscB [Gammaproteobacteria bacterium]|nr:co-chaperone HscB [Gammaproteobacteria bacterium]